MDPQLDPPLLPTHHPVAPPPHFTTAAANPTPAPSHPDYSEMITTAITELNEPEGSSKRAIAKYIETHYSNLPPTHSDLLTNHIKNLKTAAQLVMVKNSYKIPGSVPPNGAVNATPPDPPSAGTAKRRGRPPKPKSAQPAVAVPVFENTMNANATPVVVPVAVVPAAQPPPVNWQTPARGRGRPRGRPAKSGGTPKVAPASTGRGRGRPRKVATTDTNTMVVAAAAPAPVKRSGRPRGRPKRLLDVNEGVVLGGTVAHPARSGKKRGRPPKAGAEAKKPRVEAAAAPAKPGRARKRSARPVGRAGRPRKQVAPDNQLLGAYLDLKAKYDHLQSRVKRNVGVIKPCLNNEDAVNALQELEVLAEVPVNAPSGVQIQQPQAEAPQAQPPQPQQPQPVIPQFES